MKLDIDRNHIFKRKKSPSDRGEHETKKIPINNELATTRRFAFIFPIHNGANKGRTTDEYAGLRCHPEMYDACLYFFN